MNTTTERTYGPMETWLYEHIECHITEEGWCFDGVHCDPALAFAREQDAAFAALEDRIEKATEMVEGLQYLLARGGWYERAETCAAILDVLNGVER